MSQFVTHPSTWPKKPLLKAKEIGEIIRKRPSEVYKIMRDAGVTCYRIGKAVRYDPVEFERWLSAQKERA